MKPRRDAEVDDPTGHRVSMSDPGDHAATLGALAEANRMRIVELLREGPLTVGEIAARLRLRQPQTSKHLKVLSDNGIVDVTADGNRRIYGLRPEPFRELDAWLHSFRIIGEDRLDGLEDYLSTLQRREAPRTGARDEENRP